MTAPIFAHMNNQKMRSPSKDQPMEWRGWAIKHTCDGARAGVIENVVTVYMKKSECRFWASGDECRPVRVVVREVPQ